MARPDGPCTFLNNKQRPLSTFTALPAATIKRYLRLLGVTGFMRNQESYFWLSCRRQVFYTAGLMYRYPVPGIQNSRAAYLSRVWGDDFRQSTKRIRWSNLCIRYSLRGIVSQGTVHVTSVGSESNVGFRQSWNALLLKLYISSVPRLMFVWRSKDEANVPAVLMDSPNSSSVSIFREKPSQTADTSFLFDLSTSPSDQGVGANEERGYNASGAPP